MADVSQGRGSSTPGSFRLSVLRIDPGQKLHIRTLSDAYGGLFTHWRTRSQVCEGEADCRLCRTHPDRFWKGYFAGEVWDAKRGWWHPVVMELTEACELDLRYRYKRGQVWLFSREQQTSKKKTPVVATLIEELDPKLLPPAFEVFPVLRTMYHTQHIGLTAKNPLPDRVFVEPTYGAPPLEAVRTASPADDPEDREKCRRLIEEAREKWYGKPAANGNGHK